MSSSGGVVVPIGSGRRSLDLERLADVVRSRRTHKRFLPDPVPDAIVLELVELARWAPNHHLTNPWRFRLIGPGTLARIKAVAETARPGSSAKYERAPTLVAVSAKQRGERVPDLEDVLATGVATYL